MKNHPKKSSHFLTFLLNNLGILIMSFNLLTVGIAQAWVPGPPEGGPTDGNVELSGANYLNAADGDPTQVIYIDDDGDVGIGTTSPNEKLYVFGNVGTNGDVVSGYGSGGVALTVNDGYGNANVTWNHRDGTPEQNGNAARIEVNTDSTSAASMSFELKDNVSAGVATALSEIMRITSSGNVGIGTASPAYKLDIVGSAWNNIARIYSTGSSSGIDFYDTNGTRRGVVYSSSAGFGLLNNSTAWALRVNQGTNTVYIPGSVGIGTASPSYKLHVAGDIYANGGWLRTSGAAGWYNESYGGGWYMADSTWVRSYNNKPVYTGGQIRADAGFCIGGSCITSWPSTTITCPCGTCWDIRTYTPYASYTTTYSMCTPAGWKTTGAISTTPPRCPFVFSWHDDGYVMETTFLVDVIGKENQTTTYDTLKNLDVFDSPKLEIRELESETSYIDMVKLRVTLKNGSQISLGLNSSDYRFNKLKEVDRKYLVLEQGDKASLEFEELSNSYEGQIQKIELEANGYYDPKEDYMRVLEAL